MAIKNVHSAAGANYINDLLVNLRVLEEFVATPYYDRATKNADGEYQNVTIGDNQNRDRFNLRKMDCDFAIKETMPF